MKKEELKKENILLRKKYNEIILETQNLKKRLQKDLKKTKTYLNFQLIKNILPVIDSLEISYKNCSDKEIKEGIRLTLKMIKNLLLCNKVKTIKPKKNTKFNPKFQQAILKIKKHGKSNLIFNILQKGYIMCKKIIRPALVSVTSKY